MGACVAKTSPTQSVHSVQPIDKETNTHIASSVEPVPRNRIPRRASVSQRGATDLWGDLRLVAIVANDGVQKSCKKAMLKFVEDNVDYFSCFTLLSTATTQACLQHLPSLTFYEPNVNSGRIGGDADISAHIGRGNVAALFFMRSMLEVQPHQKQIDALVDNAILKNCPIYLNLATMEDAVAAFKPYIQKPGFVHYDKLAHDKPHYLAKSAIDDSLEVRAWIEERSDYVL